MWDPRGVSPGPGVETKRRAEGGPGSGQLDGDGSPLSQGKCFRRKGHVCSVQSPIFRLTQIFLFFWGFLYIHLVKYGYSQKSPSNDLAKSIQFENQIRSFGYEFRLIKHRSQSDQRA